MQLADVRDQVESEMKLNAARSSAVRIASDFAYALFENGIKPDSEHLDRMIRDADLPMRIPPFARNEAPAGPGWTPQIVEEVFKLTPDHWFSDPLTIGNDVILIFYQDRLAPYTPEFDSVRASRDRRLPAERKRELFVEKGQELTAELRSRPRLRPILYRSGREAAGLEPQEWDGFTSRTPPEGIDYNLLSRLDPIPTGGSLRHGRGPRQGLDPACHLEIPADRGTDGEDTDRCANRSPALNANVSRSLVYSDMIREELIRSGLATEP